MRLTDIVSHLDLAVYPQIGLVLFLAAFALVIVQVMRSDSVKGRSAMPLDEDDARAETAAAHSVSDKGTSR